jgi:hypothetical protein
VPALADLVQRHAAQVALVEERLGGQGPEERVDQVLVVAGLAAGLAQQERDVGAVERVDRMAVALDPADQLAGLDVDRVAVEEAQYAFAERVQPDLRRRARAERRLAADQRVLERLLGL